jgi:hypothetical protein
VELDYVVVVVVVKIDLSLHGLLLPLESRLLRGGLSTWFERDWIQKGGYEERKGESRRYCNV